MNKYRNIARRELTVPGVGVVAPGGVIEAHEGFRNANFRRVEERPETPKDEKK